MEPRTISPVSVNSLFLCSRQQVVSRPFCSVSCVEEKVLEIPPTLLQRLELMDKHERYLYLAIHVDLDQSYYFSDPLLSYLKTQKLYNGKTASDPD